MQETALFSRHTWQGTHLSLLFTRFENALSTFLFIKQYHNSGGKPETIDVYEVKSFYLFKHCCFSLKVIRHIPLPTG